MALTNLLITIVMILALPIGYLIAWLCEDELIQGRKWFILLIALSFIGAIYSYFVSSSVLGLTFAFILVVSMVSLIMGYDRNKGKI